MCRAVARQNRPNSPDWYNCNTDTFGGACARALTGVTATQIRPVVRARARACACVAAIIPTSHILLIIVPSYFILKISKYHQMSTTFYKCSSSLSLRYHTI